MKNFEEIFIDKTRDGTKMPTSEYMDCGKNVIVDQGRELIAGYTDKEEGIFEEVPAIIFGDHTRIIKYIDIPFFLGADGVKILRSKVEDANYKYLFYALKFAKIPDTGYNRHFKWLKKIKIKYPDIEKQAKIVEILDSVEIIKERLKSQLELLDELIQARFVEMFGDMMFNPNGWENISLGEICDVRDGTHDSPKYYVEGYPLITSKNVTSGKIDFTDCRLICEEDYKRINQRSKVDKGDILMPMIGTVGNPVIVDIEAKFAIKNVALIKFKENSVVSNIFIKTLLESDYFDRSVISKVRGGTQKFISLGDIRKLELCLPPISIQNQFAAFVQQVNKSKFVIHKFLYCTTHNTQSIIKPRPNTKESGKNKGRETTCRRILTF